MWYYDKQIVDIGGVIKPHVVCSSKYKSIIVIMFAVKTS